MNTWRNETAMSPRRSTPPHLHWGKNPRLKVNWKDWRVRPFYSPFTGGQWFWLGENWVNWKQAIEHKGNMGSKNSCKTCERQVLQTVWLQARILTAIMLTRGTVFIKNKTHNDDQTKTSRIQRTFFVTVLCCFDSRFWFFRIGLRQL